MKVNEVLFTNVFAPPNLEQFVLPSRIKTQFKKGIYDHFIFYGNPGIGKSELAKFLSKKHPTLYINAAIDGAVEILRNKVPQFCDEIPLNFGDFESDIKIIILDEVGRKASEAFYEGLKGFMDTNEGVRFIATTNYIQNLPPSLKSRFELVNFGFLSSDERDFVYDGYTKRMDAIIKAVKLEITPDVLKILVDTNFPDFRDSLQTIQKLKLSDNKTISAESLLSASFDFIDLYKLILSGDVQHPEKIHAELMGKYANSALDILSSLNNGFIKYIVKKEIKYASIIPEAVIEIAKYSDMMGRIDPALAMKACVFVLMRIVSSKGLK